MPRSIPDRWIPYKACGEVIEGTRIICFKVPLKTQVQKQVKEIEELWDVKSVLERIPGLTAVIDLTNTARYYDPEELKAAGVAYKKIMMAGRIIPPNGKVKEFIDVVDSVLRENKDAVIGVHCTHGLNRTGFMVCRYMRDRLGVDPRTAIARFEKARGYEIERENYIADILGQKPPPPFYGNQNHDAPKPSSSNRSSQLLSAYGDTKKNKSKKTKKPVAIESWRDNTRRSSSSKSNDDDSPESTPRINGSDGNTSRLRNFAFDYRFDY